MSGRMPVALAVQLGVIGLLVVGALAKSWAPAPRPEAHEIPVATPVADTAVIVVHDEWRRHGAGPERPCPDGTRRMDAELQAVARALEPHGLKVRVIGPDGLGAERAAVASAALVIHHNGGWGSQLPVAERDLLDEAWRAGVPLLFLGDDAAAMVAGAPVERARMGIRSVLDNGRMPVGLRVRSDVGAPPLVYGKEPDRALLNPEARVLVDAGEDTPVVWWTEAVSGPRVGVADVSLVASDVCPVMDADGVGRIGAVVTELVGRLLRR